MCIRDRLTSDNTVDETSDGYELANLVDIDEGIVNEYTQALQDETQDTDIVNYYSPAEFNLMIEYGMVEMGVGGIQGAALADYVASGGDNSHFLDMTLR